MIQLRYQYVNHFIENNIKLSSEKHQIILSNEMLKSS